jgi:hypothetical protein
LGRSNVLLHAWNDDQTSALMKNYRQSLKEALELSLRSPTIQNLGTTAQKALKALAAFPSGVEEGKLGGIFPCITGVGAVVDTLCRFSLVYRQDGFVKMLSPFRFYFLDSMVKLAQHKEVICWGPDCHPARGGTPFSFHLFCVYSLMAFEVPPIYAVGVAPPRERRHRATESATHLWM